MPKLSVIVPVYNSASFIRDTLDSFLSIDEFTIQIICIDDGSLDDTVEVIKSIKCENHIIDIIEHGENRGAGIARNTGFDHVESEFVLFFDADDVLHADGLTAAVKLLELSDLDFVMCSYNLCETRDIARPMHQYDQSVYDEILAGEAYRFIGLQQAKALCSVTNYPWNKVISTTYAKEIGLRFGGTKVHNDILGHWMLLASCRKMALHSFKICSHIVDPNGSNLTNIRSGVRMELFKAFDELDDFLDCYPVRKTTLLRQLVAFKLTAIRWANERVPVSELDRFDEMVRRSFSNMSFREYLELDNEDKLLASQVNQLRFGMIGSHGR